MDPKTQHLLTAKPLPLLVRMAAPSTLAFLVQGSVSLAEVWFIGQLGSISLAAIALAFPFLMLTQTLSGGAMGGAVASAIARALGAGDIHRAEQLIWHALALGAAGALALLLLFGLGGEAFLRLLGGNGDALAQAHAYTYLLLSGGILIWSLGITTAIFRGMGNMQLPAGAMILGALIQIPLSGCLILGAFGLPKLGITGAAVSAIVSGALVSGVLLMQLRNPSSLVKLRFSALVFSKANFEDILKVALPASLSPILTVSTVLILTALVGTFGDAALAGYGIGSRVEFLIIPLVFGFGAAMTSLVGMSIGAGNTARAERIALDRWRLRQWHRWRSGNLARAVPSRLDHCVYKRPGGRSLRNRLYADRGAVLLFSRAGYVALLRFSRLKLHAMASNRDDFTRSLSRLGCTTVGVYTEPWTAGYLLRCRLCDDGLRIDHCFCDWSRRLASIKRRFTRDAKNKGQSDEHRGRGGSETARASIPLVLPYCAHPGSVW